MRDDHAFEALLREALLRRGAPAPFSVDVADQVMARVVALGAPTRTELTLRQFGRWAAAASIVGATLTATAVWQARGLASGFEDLLHTTADAIGALLKLATPLGSLVETLGRVGLAILTCAQTLMQPLQPFQPLARLTLVVVAAAMLFITTYVVGRDVRAHVADKERA
jgi:hypothetical protein